jgi:membrane protein implicated in regulation of membrane protease activity
MDGGDFLLYIFIGCLAFGVFYSAGAIILGGHGDSDHDLDMDHDVGVGDGVDIGHDISTGDGIDLGHDIGTVDGIDGVDGVDGVDIDLDIDGIDGVDGIDGIDGVDGVDGMDGVDGLDGADADHDGGTHQRADGDDAGSPSPFNPLVMASAITTFGGVGIISMVGFGMNSFISTIIALASAFVIGAALFFGVVRFMYGSQSNSVFSHDDLINIEAEILTPIPENGFGEIAYMVNGIRSTLSAKSTEGNPIRRGATVIIREIDGSVAMVQQKMTIDDIVLENTSQNSQTGGGSGDSGASEDSGGTGGAGDSSGTGDAGDSSGTGGAGDSSGTGDTGDSSGRGDTGELEDEDSGKPRRNAGNIN